MSTTTLFIILLLAVILADTIYFALKLGILAIKNHIETQKEKGGAEYAQSETARVRAIR